MAKKPLAVRTHRHADKRVNIPTAEVEPVMLDEDKSPVRLAYGGMGESALRHLAPVRPAWNRADRGEGDQPSRG